LLSTQLDCGELKDIDPRRVAETTATTAIQQLASLHRKSRNHATAEEQKNTTSAFRLYDEWILQKNRLSSEFDAAMRMFVSIHMNDDRALLSLFCFCYACSAAIAAASAIMFMLHLQAKAWEGGRHSLEFACCGAVWVLHMLTAHGVAHKRSKPPSLAHT
jgi:hypothetical protein